MTKQEFKPMTWLVKHFDSNKQEILNYDVLKYIEKDIKHFKKLADGCKVIFEEALRREMSWRYWSKCEYELIIEIDNSNGIWLKPWVGCLEPEKVRIEVTDDSMLNWRSFAEEHINKQKYKNKAKIDIYDQLMFRWQEFVDYCWEYRHKWQRANKIEGR